MRKLFYLGMIWSVLLLLSTCTTVTTTPTFYSNNTNTKFEILGEVVYESATRIGYTELLRAARNLYPDCDYVIDIMVDRRETTTTFKPFWDKSIKDVTWIMRGTAIRYER